MLIIEIEYANEINKRLYFKSNIAILNIRSYFLI